MDRLHAHNTIVLENKCDLPYLHACRLSPSMPAPADVLVGEVKGLKPLRIMVGINRKIYRIYRRMHWW